MCLCPTGPKARSIRPRPDPRLKRSSPDPRHPPRAPHPLLSVSTAGLTPARSPPPRSLALLHVGLLGAGAMSAWLPACAQHLACRRCWVNTARWLRGTCLPFEPRPLQQPSSQPGRLHPHARGEFHYSECRAGAKLPRSTCRAETTRRAPPPAGRPPPALTGRMDQRLGLRVTASPAPHPPSQALSSPS